MNNVVEITADEIVDYMIKNNVSIRPTAEHFGCSVGTIWNRLHAYKGEKKTELTNLLKKNIDRGHNQLNDKKE